VAKAGAATHVGLVRSQNQDTMLVMPGYGLFVVADGLGGEACGDVASRIAVETVERAAGDGQSLREAVAAADRAVALAAAAGDGRAGMGCTIVALRVDGGRWELAWVGDSRAYRVNPGAARGIERLTRDHSLVQELLDQGAIGEEEARSHPHRHLVTRALGSLGSADSVDCSQGAVAEGDLFVLCSDGLHGLLEDRDIRSTVEDSGTPQAAAEALVRKALEAGGVDNVTVIVVSAE